MSGRVIKRMEVSVFGVSSYTPISGLYKMLLQMWIRLWSNSTLSHFSSQDFPAPCAGYQQHMNECSPFDGFQLQRIPDSFYLFQLEIVYFWLFRFWLHGSFCGVIRNNPLFYCLIQNG